MVDPEIKPDQPKVQRDNPDLSLKSGCEDFYVKFGEEIRLRTHASKEMIYAGLQYLVSLSLCQASIENEMGNVTAAISFLVLAPSGSSKTPLLDLFKELLVNFPGYHNNYVAFGTFSPEGIRKHLSRLTQVEKEGTYNMTIIRDEVSTLAKSTKTGMLSSAGLEFLSQTADGRLDPYDTIRSGHETYPERIYCPMWLAGTKTFLDHIPEDFWIQGFAFRTLSVPEGEIIPTGIEFGIKSNEFRELRDYMQLLTNVKEFKATPSFQKAYNDEILNVQRMLAETQKKGASEQIENRVFSKHQVQLLRLSMIHAVPSSFGMGYVKKNIKGRELETHEADRDVFSIPNTTVVIPRNYTIIMDVPDLVKAKSDLEMYSHSFVNIYYEYLRRSEMKIRGGNMGSLERRFANTVLDLYEKEKTYKISPLVTEKDGKVTLYECAKDKGGAYVLLSDISRKNTWSHNTLDMLVKTMSDQEIIEIITAMSPGNRKPTRLVRMVNPEKSD